LGNINKFWEFKNSTDTESELMLYGQIASDRPWWDESEKVVQNEFIKELNNQGGKNLRLRINSVGGDVFAAHTILTNIKLYKEKYNAKIISQIDGLAASAATIIMTGADIIMAPSYASIMIHDPLIFLFGYYSGADLQKATNAWASIKESILNAYSLKFNKDREELNQIMSTETWMTGEEAKEKGYVDELMFKESDDDMLAVSNDNNYLFVAGVKHDLSIFKHKPIFNNSVIQHPVMNKNQDVNNIQSKNEGGTKEVEIKNVEDLKKAYPDLVNDIINTTKDESAKNERERLKAIDEIANSLSPELVTNAKYGEKVMNAQELAFEAIKNDAKKGVNYLDDVKNDMQSSNSSNVTVNPKSQDQEVKEKASEEVVNSMVEGANSRREI